jgi:multicomponent Na+:H+ antiporter subunit C
MLGPAIDFLIGHFNAVTYIVLMMLGLHAMTGKSNLVKKLVGMNIFQWSIILFVVSLGAKRGATIPIVLGDHGGPGVIEAHQYVNPLPHVLMLTAIVVGVATTGVALALLLRIHRRYGTLEEDVLLERLRASRNVG